MTTPQTPPPDDSPVPPSAASPETHSAPEPPKDIVLPRGCNPLTFGVVMATLEMAVFLVLWQRCR